MPIPGFGVLGEGISLEGGALLQSSTPAQLQQWLRGRQYPGHCYLPKNPNTRKPDIQQVLVGPICDNSHVARNINMIIWFA